LPHREPEGGVAALHADRGAQQRLRRVGAALHHHVLDAQPEICGGLAEARAHRLKRRAGRGAVDHDGERD
jgi:hypothetical protein